MRIARSFRPRRALKRDSEKSTESGGRPLRVEEAARVERLWTVREMATRTVADRTDQSNDGRTRKERVDSDSGDDAEQRLKKRKR